MKIKPIILASGFAKRFGENKLLTDIDGKPMVLHIIHKTISLNKRGVFSTPLVVTQYKEIEEICRENNVASIFNPKAEKGISTSIKAGILATEETDFYMFFTGDQPFLKESTIENFVQSFRKKNFDLGCVENKGKWGNPAIFKQTYKDKLLSLEGDIGGKKFLYENKDKVFLFSVDEIEVFDIDLKSHLRR